MAKETPVDFEYENRVQNEKIDLDQRMVAAICQEVMKMTIKMTLGAKLKLGFIDGSSPKPAVIHNDYQRWVRCDYMVTCLILNSMVAELSESFLYAQSASNLWKELEERCGQINELKVMVH
nr:hypothetical protein [Tanacetum cinerariifolium]